MNGLRSARVLGATIGIVLAASWIGTHLLLVGLTIGLVLGYLVGHRAGRRRAALDQASEIVRSRARAIGGIP